MGDIAQYEFKGVTVVIATLLMFLLCQQPSGAGAIRAVQSAVTVPYCVFLNQSQELDCVCPDAAGEPDSNHVDSAPLNFPSEDYLVASGNSSVASIKLHSCQSVNLRLDLRPLARPFYR